AVPEQQTAYLDRVAIGRGDPAISGGDPGHVHHGLAGDYAKRRVRCQVDVERPGSAIGHGAGDSLLLQVDLVRSECAAGRWHSRVSVHLNALTLMDCGRVKGEGCARQSAAEVVA